MSSGSKRTRSANFSSMEVELLLELVGQQKIYLENPKTDSVTSMQKNKAWEQITEQFNATTIGEARTTKVLREKYRNLKQDLKKRRAEERRHNMGTGGGPYKPPDETRADALLVSLLQEEVVDGLKNDYDCDAVSERNVQVTFNAQSEMPQTPNDKEKENIPEVEIPIEETWTNYNPQQLKKRKSEQLRVSTKKKQNVDKALKHAQLILVKKQIKLCEEKIKLTKLRIARERL